VGRFIHSDSHIFWEFTMAMLGFETYRKINGNEDVPKYITTQYNYWMSNFTEDWITSMNLNNNPAADDAAWTSMAMMLCFYTTGNGKALKICAQTVQNAYKHWADKSGIENGLFYRDDVRAKTLYACGLMYSALRYHELTKGTSSELPKLYEDTLALYNWTEEHLLRDGSKEYNGITIAEDYIYYNDFTDDGEHFEPGFLGGPNALGASSLFGNMGMACIHKKLYDLTGEQKYLDRAVRTANAIANFYDHNGMFMNDRDAWTDAAFAGYFVSEVMPLKGVDRKLGTTFLKTAFGIMNNCYYEGGYYGGQWSGARDWSVEYEATGNAMVIMTSATSTHMLYAAALASKLGLIDYTESDLELLEKGYKTLTMSAEMEKAGRVWKLKKKTDK